LETCIETLRISTSSYSKKPVKFDFTGFLNLI
jgi:hypothetical protein